MENKTKLIWLGGLFLVVVVIIWVFLGLKSTGNIVQSHGEDIKIGFVGPLSGDFSVLGESIVTASELAINEINSERGVNGRRMKIIYEDGKCDANTAFSSGNKLINFDNVNYLLMGCSPGTLAIAPVAEENGVVVLAYASSSPDVTSAGDYIFRTYKNDGDAGEALAKYMYDEKIRNVAVLWGLNDYTQGIADVFIKDFESLGGDITFKESFETSLKDYRTIIAKMKEKNIDAIVLLDFSEGVINYFQQTNELGVEFPVYGVDNFDDPKIAQNLGKLFDGARYVEIKQSASQDFREKMKQKTGSDALTIGTTNIYDSVYILAKAIGSVGDNPENVKNYLYEMPSYIGESGTIKFDSNGDLEAPQFELREITDGKPIVIS